MIVKKENSKAKQFYGVSFEVLANGEQSMIAKMLYKKKDFVPFDKHPHEQSGYVISGKYRISFGEYRDVIGPVDTYSILGGVEHSIEIIEPGEVLDFFSPPREDYL